MKLTEDSVCLCTFITPVGRFRYLRLPFGISCAPEIYHRTVYNMFSHIEGVETSMDDICIGGKTREEHDNRVQQVLDICRHQGLKLNRDKCKVGVQEMVFLGDVISDKGIRPDPCKVRAVKEFPTPTRPEELQRFLGMVKYLGRFLEDLSKQTYNLRSLLRKDVKWTWLDIHQREMDNLKNLVCSKPILQFYDPDLPIRITTDASMKGLGAVLQQKYGKDWKPVAYASRSTTDAESRYATIEKETLAIEFACTRFHQYIFGQKVELETDHKPLVAIFTKSLNDCPARIQRMRLKLQKYALELRYTPGVEIVAADTLSRGPLTESGQEEEKGQRMDIPDVRLTVHALASAPVRSPWDEKREVDIEAQNTGLLTTMPITDRKRLLMKQETAKDPVLRQLLVIISQGWPIQKGNCPLDLIPYWNYRDELVVADGLVLKGMRIVVPSSLQAEMLEKIHTGHLGMEKCKRRARAVMFWPKMNLDIENLVRHCSVCLRYKPAQPAEPLKPHPIPTKPFEKVGADLCAINNKHYLVLVDYYTNFLYWYEVNKQTSAAVITACKHLFSQEGIPMELFSDNGPCFNSSEFRGFAMDWDFKHNTSSPGFSQSNGLAESGVKRLRHIIEKCDLSQQDRCMGILNYNATPLDNGYSPAELRNNGRNIRSNLPMTPEGRVPSYQEYEDRKLKEKLKQQYYHDGKGVASLPAIRPGNTVRIKASTNRWTIRGTVLEEVAPRSYIVRTESGSILRRNRRDLLVTPETTPLIVPMEFEDNSTQDIMVNDTSPQYLPVEHEETSSTPTLTPQPEVSPRTPAPQPELSEPSLAVARPRREIRKPQRLIENI